MAWFSVGVEARNPGRGTRDVDEWLLDGFVDAVAAYDGVVGGGRGAWDARISVEADDADRAAMAGAELVRKAAAAAGLPEWPLVRLEATRQDVLSEELARPNYPELVSGPEAAELLGVSRQRLYQLAAQHQGFPEPLYRLRVGPLWVRSAIESFAQRWERKPGRPRKTA
jgi:predicted DNA-binding transcriptional regulator AlpA